MPIERIKALQRGIVEQAARAKIPPRWWLYIAMGSIVAMMLLIGYGGA